MGKKHNKYREKKDNRKIDNTLENVLEGFRKITSKEHSDNDFPYLCGYVRLPHTNDNGLIQGYCPIKSTLKYTNKNCVRYEDKYTGENCPIYKKYFGGKK